MLENPIAVWVKVPARSRIETVDGRRVSVTNAIPADHYQGYIHASGYWTNEDNSGFVFLVERPDTGGFEQVPSEWVFTKEPEGNNVE